jgi:hypothetical protein
MKIYGIAFIKNGVKFDYPFKESLLSMLPLVEKIYVNVGICDDGTLEEVRKIPKVEIIEVNWDDHRSDKGYIFSDMTNIPIKKMREEVKDEDAWALYLQSDELIHEDDLELIKEDIKKANDAGADVMRFRYMHFWMKNNEVAIGKRWYPQEIRAFKVNSTVISHGDAQTFQDYNKAYESNAHIWHYGHVRDEAAYKRKVAQFNRYYRRGFHLYRKEIKSKIKAFFCPEKTALFYGRHPKLAHQRILRQGGQPFGPRLQAVHLKGDTSKFTKELLAQINTDKLTIGDQAHSPDAKIINVDKIKYKKSFSPLCREWTPDFQLIMELSRQGVSFK